MTAVPPLWSAGVVGPGVIPLARPKGCQATCETVPVTVLVQLLADAPELIEPIGRMRFAEWGDDNGVHEWISVTRREAGRDGLPVTWVAVDEVGTALGAVALGSSDVPERPDLVPCIWGMVVRSDLRGRGIGRLLLQRLERHAGDSGHTAVWVLTGPSAVGYYEHCGWQRVEEIGAGILLRKPIHRSFEDLPGRSD